MSIRVVKFAIGQVSNSFKKMQAGVFCRTPNVSEFSDWG